MVRVSLYEPRIPQNTGNIGRTCLAYDYSLDLIHPLGFNLDNKQLKRAGLDYWKHLNVKTHLDFSNYKQYNTGSRIIGFTKNGGIPLMELNFYQNDCLLFGREDNGLPSNIKSECDLIATIPMPGIKSNDNLNGVRSLNLSVACGIVCYTVYTKLIENTQ